MVQPGGRGAEGPGGHSSRAGGAADWGSHFERERGRYLDGERRLPSIDDPDERQRQLTRMGNAAGGAGLALLMSGRSDESAAWFGRAADRYRESYGDAPPGSWGRPIGAIKARVLADDWAAAETDARWAVAEGAGDSESPIGRYAACLAHLVLGDDAEAARLADSLAGAEFPPEVANSLAAIARRDSAAYGDAVAGVLRSFEARDEYLEGVPVADTVVVLQRLAVRRGLRAVIPASPLVPE